MANLTKEELIEHIGNMTVMELAEFVKALEERFGVTAVAPLAPSAVTPSAPQQVQEEEKTEYSVILTGVGDKKIQVIKVVRAVTGLGLKEAKDLVDGAPKPVKEGISKKEAEEIKAQLLEVGASVEIK
jgi:large subunit ribosomal protein L7/L12